MALALGTSKGSWGTASTNPVQEASITLAANSKVFILLLAKASTTARAGGTPTFGGQDLTQAGTAQAGSGEGNSELWYLIDPPLTSSTLSIPNSDSVAIYYTYASLTGAGVELFGTPQQTGVTSGTPSLTINDVPAGGAVISVLADGTKNAPSARSHTALIEDQYASWSSLSQYGLIGSLSNVTMSWTLTSDDVAMIMAAFKEVAPNVNIGSAGSLVQTAGATEDKSVSVSSQPTLSVNVSENIRYRAVWRSVATKPQHLWPFAVTGDYNDQGSTGGLDLAEQGSGNSFDENGLVLNGNGWAIGGYSADVSCLGSTFSLLIEFQCDPAAGTWYPFSGAFLGGSGLGWFVQIETGGAINVRTYNPAGTTNQFYETGITTDIVQIIWVHSGGNSILYKNGALLKAAGAHPDPLDQSSDPFAIGAADYLGVAKFVGTIVRAGVLKGTAWSADDVADIYNKSNLVDGDIPEVFIESPQEPPLSIPAAGSLAETILATEVPGAGVSSQPTLSIDVFDTAKATEAPEIGALTQPALVPAPIQTVLVTEDKTVSVSSQPTLTANKTEAALATEEHAESVSSQATLAKDIADTGKATEVPQVGALSHPDLTVQPQEQVTTVEEIDKQVSSQPDLTLDKIEAVLLTEDASVSEQVTLLINISDTARVSPGGSCDDDFTGTNGNPPDSARWNIIAGSPNIQDNQLELDTGDADSVLSKFYFNDNFDIQVDYNNPWVPTSSWILRLGILIDGTHQGYIGAGYISGYKRAQKGSVNGGSWTYTNYIIALDASKLRIVRHDGNQFNFYYWNGTDWYAVVSNVVIGSAGNDVYVQFFASMWDSYPDVTGYLDNFTINSGTPLNGPDIAAVSLSTQATLQPQPEQAVLVAEVPGASVSSQPTLAADKTDTALATEDAASFVSAQPTISIDKAESALATEDRTVQVQDPAAEEDLEVSGPLETVLATEDKTVQVAAQTTLQPQPEQAVLVTEDKAASVSSPATLQPQPIDTGRVTEVSAAAVSSQATLTPSKVETVLVAEVPGIGALTQPILGVSKLETGLATEVHAEAVSGQPTLSASKAETALATEVPQVYTIQPALATSIADAARAVEVAEELISSQATLAPQPVQTVLVTEDKTAKIDIDAHPEQGVTVSEDKAADLLISVQPVQGVTVTEDKVAGISSQATLQPQVQDNALATEAAPGLLIGATQPLDILAPLETVHAVEVHAEAVSSQADRTVSVFDTGRVTELPEIGALTQPILQPQPVQTVTVTEDKAVAAPQPALEPQIIEAVHAVEDKAAAVSSQSTLGVSKQEAVAITEIAPELAIGAIQPLNVAAPAEAVLATEVVAPSVSSQATLAPSLADAARVTEVIGADAAQPSLAPQPVQGVVVTEAPAAIISSQAVLGPQPVQTVQITEARTVEVGEPVFEDIQLPLAQPVAASEDRAVQVSTQPVLAPSVSEAVAITEPATGQLAALAIALAATDSILITEQAQSAVSAQPDRALEVVDYAGLSSMVNLLIHVELPPFEGSFLKTVQLVDGISPIIMHEPSLNLILEDAPLRTVTDD